MPGPEAPNEPARAGAPDASPREARAAAAATAFALGALALEVLAVAPQALGGIVLRGPCGDGRRRWLEALRAALPEGSPWRPLPIAVDDDRLLGGLDLGATLAAGRPVQSPGLLAESDGGVVVLAMAERVAAGTAAQVAAALDVGAVLTARHGSATTRPARFAVVVLDEGEDADERAPRSLADRAALHLRTGDWLAGADWSPDDGAIERARGRWRGVAVDDAAIGTLTATAVALGIGSLRPPSFALSVARVVAALRGRDRVEREDLEAAAALVLAPRATRLPAAEPEAEPADAPAETPSAESPSESSPPRPPPDAADAPPADATESPDDSGPMDETVVAAAVAAIPPDLLAALKSPAAAPRSTPSVGRSGAAAAHALHGRPLGARPGRPRNGVRLDLLATLRAAAPWQVARRAAERPRPAAAAHAGGPTASASGTGTASAPGPRGGTTAVTSTPQRRLHIRPSDLHVRRTQAKRRTTTIFAVDASGSAALHRLAEAKGAVELLLADCYVRRDSVAVVAFRGRAADVLLPPTRSLTRAKRALGELPGGGGTPLAAGLDMAADLAAAATRRGETAVVVVLSDGRANVARDGTPGREGGERDARVAARRLAAQGVATLFVDTSPRPGPSAPALAALLRAPCIALPHADAAALSRAVRGISGAPAVRAARPAADAEGLARSHG